MKPKILIGYSACQLTRAAFESAGVEAWTCDLLPARGDSAQHIQGDVWDALRSYDWVGAVLHPMFTYLTVSAAWALKDPDFDRYPGVGYHQRVKPGTLTGAARRKAQAQEIENFRLLLALPFPVAIENPAPSFLSTAICPPDQVIHPHQFGDDASKGTGLWLTRGLPKLQPTAAVAPRYVDGKPRWANQTDGGQNKLTPSDDRWLERSKTYPGIAAAMGAQWGRWILEQQTKGFSA